METKDEKDFDPPILVDENTANIHQVIDDEGESANSKEIDAIQKHVEESLLFLDTAKTSNNIGEETDNLQNNCPANTTKEIAWETSKLVENEEIKTKVSNDENEDSIISIENPTISSAQKNENLNQENESSNFVVQVQNRLEVPEKMDVDLSNDASQDFVKETHTIETEGTETERNKIKDDEFEKKSSMQKGIEDIESEIEQDNPESKVEDQSKNPSNTSDDTDLRDDERKPGSLFYPLFEEKMNEDMTSTQDPNNEKKIANKTEVIEEDTKLKSRYTPQDTVKPSTLLEKDSSPLDPKLKQVHEISDKTIESTDTDEEILDAAIQASLIPIKNVQHIVDDLKNIENNVQEQSDVTSSVQDPEKKDVEEIDKDKESEICVELSRNKHKENPSVILIENDIELDTPDKKDENEVKRQETLPDHPVYEELSQNKVKNNESSILAENDTESDAPGKIETKQQETVPDHLVLEELSQNKVKNNETSILSENVTELDAPDIKDEIETKQQETVPDHPVLEELSQNKVKNNETSILSENVTELDAPDIKDEIETKQQKTVPDHPVLEEPSQNKVKNNETSILSENVAELDAPDIKDEIETKQQETVPDHPVLEELSQNKVKNSETSILSENVAELDAPDIKDEIETKQQETVPDHPVLEELSQNKVKNNETSILSENVTELDTPDIKDEIQTKQQETVPEHPISTDNSQNETNIEKMDVDSETVEASKEKQDISNKTIIVSESEKDPMSVLENKSLDNNVKLTIDMDTDQADEETTKLEDQKVEEKVHIKPPTTTELDNTEKSPIIIIGDETNVSKMEESLVYNVNSAHSVALKAIPLEGQKLPQKRPADEVVYNENSAHLGSLKVVPLVDTTKATEEKRRKVDKIVYNENSAHLGSLKVVSPHDTEPSQIDQTPENNITYNKNSAHLTSLKVVPIQDETIPAEVPKLEPVWSLKEPDNASSISSKDPGEFWSQQNKIERSKSVWNPTPPTLEPQWETVTAPEVSKTWSLTEFRDWARKLKIIFKNASETYLNAILARSDKYNRGVIRVQSLPKTVDCPELRQFIKVHTKNIDPEVAENIAYIHIENNPSKMFNAAYVIWRGQSKLLAFKALQILKKTGMLLRKHKVFYVYGDRSNIDWDKNDRPIIKKKERKEEEETSDPTNPPTDKSKEKVIQTPLNAVPVFISGQPDYRNTDTFGLREEFLNSLNITLPLSCTVLVSNLDKKLDVTQVRHIFQMAGSINSLKISSKEEYLDATIEYDHPLEAVQAISLFHKQEHLGRDLELTLDTSVPKKTKFQAPEGFKKLGPGLGKFGTILHGVRVKTEVENLRLKLFRAIQRLRTGLGAAKIKVDEALNTQHSVNNKNKQTRPTTEPAIDGSQNSASQQNQQDLITSLSNALANTVQNNLLSAMSAQPNPQGAMAPNQMATGNWATWPNWSAPNAEAYYWMPPSQPNITTSYNPNLQSPKVQPEYYQSTIQPKNVVNNQPSNSKNDTNPFLSKPSTSRFDIPPSTPAINQPYMYPANTSLSSSKASATSTDVSAYLQNQAHIQSCPISYINPSSADPTSYKLDIPPPVPKPQNRGSTSQTPITTLKTVPLENPPKPVGIKFNIPSLQSMKEKGSSKKPDFISKPVKPQKRDSKGQFTRQDVKKPAYEDTQKANTSEGEMPWIKKQIKAMRRSSKSPERPSKYNKLQEREAKILEEMERVKETARLKEAERQKEAERLKEAERQKEAERERQIEEERHRETDWYRNSKRRRDSDKDRSASVIFKYLPPSVTSDDLRDKMREIGKVVLAQVNGKGQALVTFRFSRDAETCIEMYNLSKVDGQTIEAKWR